MQTERIDTPIGRHYRIDGRLYPSVTTILAATRPGRDAESLALWAANVGEEQAEQIRSQAAQRGTALHLLVEHYLAGNPLDLERVEKSGVLPWWRSVLPVLERLVSVQAIEQTVFHEGLGYAGTFDLLAQVSVVDPWGAPAGQRSILIDWKTSSKQKRREWLGDYPIQLAAYWGALEQPSSVEEGWIVLAHPLGPAQQHRFRSAEFKPLWEMWLRRLELFREHYGSESTPWKISPHPEI